MECRLLSSGFLLLQVLLLLLVARDARAVQSFNVTFRNMTRIHQLQDVKTRILTGLRLENIPVLPKGIKKPAVLKALSQLHDSSAVSGTQNYYRPESIAFVLFSEPSDVANNKNILQFRLNGQNNENYIEVKSASLFMHIRKKKRKSNRLRKKQRKLKILIHRYEKTNGIYKRVALMKFKATKTKWLKLDLPKWTIENDINSSNKTIRLRLSCKRCTKTISLDLLYKKNKTRKKKKKKKKKNNRNKLSKKRKLSSTRPFLVIHTVPVVLSRAGRSANTCPETDDAKRCCAIPLDVDFREIGWDKWIIFPSAFTTAVCYGDCSKSTTPSTTCTATSMKPLSVLYYRQHNVIVRTTIPDLIYTSCGCR